MRNALIQTHFIMVAHHDFSSAIKSESQVLEYKANLNVVIWTYSLVWHRCSFILEK